MENQSDSNYTHRCTRSVRCFACAVSSATWLLFTAVPTWFVVLCVRCPRPLCSCSPVHLLGVLCCVWVDLGYLASVHRCPRWVCCVSCALSWARRLLFSGVPTRCVALLVRCPGHLAPVHLFACSVCCVACVVSWVSCLLFTGVPAWFIVLHLRCPPPLGSCSPVRLLGVFCCVCRVLRHLPPVHRSARPVCCVACALSRATLLLYTGVPASSAALLVRCPRLPGSCSPVCPLRLLFCLCGVLGHLAPVHRCARSVCCFVCAVS